MTDRLRQSGLFAVLALVGLVILAAPAISGQSQPAVVSSAANGTATPTETSGLLTPPDIIGGTGTPTPTASPTPTPATDDGTGPGATGAIVVDDGVVPQDCADRDHRTIQDAVSNASSGQTIVICSGTYEGSFTVNTRDLTLQADGDAVINSTTTQTTPWLVRITAPGVALAGFDIRAVQSRPRYAIAVGAPDVTVRDNTVLSAGYGVFLSDGLNENGAPDPDFSAATGSHVGGNRITANYARIWTDADRTVVQDNYLTNVEGHPINTISFVSTSDEANTSIVSSGNGTVIRNNTANFTQPNDFPGNGITIGLPTRPQGEHGGVQRVPDHNRAHNNLVEGNTILEPPARSLKITESNGTIIRNEHHLIHFRGIEVEDSYDLLIRNNTIHGFPPEVPDAVYVRDTGNASRNITIANNTIYELGDGVVTGSAGVDVIGNTISDTERSEIIYFGNSSGRILYNRLVDSGNDGIAIEKDDIYPPLQRDRERVPIEVHYNHILRPNNYAIHNTNDQKNDGNWPIVNATHNYWGCGGPSGGLADPETGTRATGPQSNGHLSAGDEAGVSNVRFDPFIEAASCASGTPTPTSTPTPSPNPTLSPTATPTATATATPTPTPTPAAVDQTGTGSGEGQGPGGGQGPGPGTSDGTTGDQSEETATGQPLATPTESLSPTDTRTPTDTPSPTDTQSPTPTTEPGFGVLTWLVGLIVAALLAVRRAR